MPQLRVFVSSTARDLSQERERVKGMIESLGHQAVLSEFSGVLYDPNQHTQEACVQELKTCDVAVLIVGARFGSRALPEFVERLDEKLLDTAQVEPREPMSLKDVSVTQLEAYTSFQHRIPVFAFVSASLQSDRRFLEKNAHLNLPEGEELIFSTGIARPDLEYISKFLKYIENRSSNNAIIEYSRIEDVLTHLRTQWSHLLQKLLRERLEDRHQADIMQVIRSGIDDLKSGLLVSVTTDEAREVASGVMKFRALCDFISSFMSPSAENVIAIGPETLKEALRDLGVRRVIFKKPGNEDRIYMNNDVLFISEEGYSGALGLSREGLKRFSLNWSEFMKMNKSARGHVYGAIADQGGFRTRRYRRDANDLTGSEWRHMDIDDWINSPDLFPAGWVKIMETNEDGDD